MKRLFIAVLALVSIALAACTAAQQADVTKLAATAQTNARSACALVQPTLADIAAAYPGDAKAATLAADNGKICAAVAALDPASVQTLVNTTIPEAIGLVGAFVTDRAKAQQIQSALGVLSLALSNWLAFAAQPIVTDAPASSAVSA